MYYKTSNPYYVWPPPGASGRRGVPSASTFGALPFYQVPSQPSMLVFELTDYDPDILNSNMIGPNAEPYPVVISNPRNSPEVTVIQSFRSETMASIQWPRHSTIEIVGLLPRQRISKWLRLSPDGRNRIMDVNNVRYMWTPQGQSLCLFRTDNRSLCCQVTQSRTSVRIEIDCHAIQQGLLEAVVVATVILLSGKNID